MALNAAVIGLGVGRGHIAAYREAGAVVAAICDVNAELLERVGEEEGVRRRYTDYRVMANLDGIDVVSICTPDHLHADPAVAMLSSGKHVLVEKPMSTTFEDIERIVQTSRRTGRKVSHGCQIRFDETFQELKRQVEARAFGQLFYAEADYISNHLDLFREGWRGRLGSRYNAAAGGSIHPVDVIQWIVDSPAVEVAAYGNGISAGTHGMDVTDCVVGIIRFENGCVAKTFTTMGSARPGFRNVQIYGTGKTFLTSPAPPARLVSDLQNRKWTPLEVPEEGGDSRRKLIEDLLKAIENDTEPQVNLEQSVRTAAICVALFESVRSGKPVAVPRF